MTEVKVIKWLICSTPVKICGVGSTQRKLYPHLVHHQDQSGHRTKQKKQKRKATSAQKKRNMAGKKKKRRR